MNIKSRNDSRSLLIYLEKRITNVFDIIFLI